MMLVQELYAAAVSMQREGMAPHEIAVRLIERARENGVISIIHRSSPPKLELVFEGAEYIIRFDGASWQYEAHS